jgi:ubiquinone/menaquinone biosynthesis C-methylase UbiE
MSAKPSARIASFVAALPLRPGMRVLEIGCGPGVAARLAAGRVGPKGFVLAIDRSESAIALARAGSMAEMEEGRLDFRQSTAEDFALAKGEKRFDLAFAMRVGALDGRHSEIEHRALERTAAALVPGGRLYIDGGDPLREVKLPGGR